MIPDSVFKFIRGLVRIRGGSDNSVIGNVEDQLKARITFSPENLTSFGRLKASLPTVIFQFNFTENARTDLFDTSTTGSATITYDANEATRNLNTTTASGDEAILQTFRRIKYTPGQQNAVIFVNNFDPKENVTQQASYCDGSDGFHIRMTGTVFSVGLTSSISGTPVETNITQANLNGDKLDGTGPSGITADFSKTIIFFVQFQWLGAGVVQFWASVEGIPVLLHTFHHSNILDDTKYMRTATQPLRYRITNTGTVASPTTMRVSCASSISEGATTFHATKRFVYNADEVSLTSNGTIAPLIAIRLKSTSKVSNLNIIKASVLALSIDAVAYEVVIGGTLTGGTWESVDDTSTAEVNRTATSHTGGIVLDGAIVAEESFASIEDEGNAIKVGKFIDGTSQIALLRARTLNNNADVTGAITFEEDY